MPNAYTILKDRDVPLVHCPNCGASPFEPFMRGQVKNGWRAFWGKPAWCLICSKCKGIVDYEDA